MPPADTIREEDVRRAVEVTRAHASAEALGGLAFDVLSRQAEGRSLFAGKEYLESRVEALGVDREAADTELGNLVAVLERGPKSAGERALVAALAVRGLATRLEGDGDADGDAARAERVPEFVRRADWLEVSSPYAVYAFVDPLLPPGAAAAVWAGLAGAALAEPCPAKGPRHDGRAHNAARLAALAASESDAARGALLRVARESEEPTTRALARHLLGQRVDEGGDVSVRGRLSAPPRGALWTSIRLVTGLAAAGWALRLMLNLVGTRREAQLSLIPGGLRMRRRDMLLGRMVRERDETFTLAALASVARQVRYPMLHLLTGLVALSLGVLIGGMLLFDAARTGETVLLVYAAVAVLLGAGLDLALDVLVPARRGLVRVDLEVLPRRAIQLTGVPLEEADRFLLALRDRIG